MDGKIKTYADALYEQGMHESGRAAREDQANFQREMAARQTGDLPLGGTEIQGMLRVKVAHIERCILSRLDSYHKAFDEIGATPTDQDLTDILNELQAVQQLQVQHSAQALSDFLKARGGHGDLTGSLREASAHGYDRALQKWKSWRARVRLRRSAPMTENTDKARRVWVVHGRDGALRSAMFIFLRSIGLEPLEFSEARGLTRSASPYVGEILDAAFAHAQAVVVLLTPDDEARLRPDLLRPNDPPYERVPTGQARPNVLFEAGMALVSHPTRTVLVEIGGVRPFSDVAGRHVVHMDGSTQKRQDIADRLRTAGCPVNVSGTDWHTAGEFVNPYPVEGLRRSIEEKDRELVELTPPEQQSQLRLQAQGVAHIIYDYELRMYKHSFDGTGLGFSIVIQIVNLAVRSVPNKPVRVRAQAMYKCGEDIKLLSPLVWVDSPTSDVVIGPGEIRELVIAHRGPHNFWDFVSHGHHGSITPTDGIDFDLEIDLIGLDDGKILDVKPQLYFHWHWREGPLTPHFYLVEPPKGEERTK